MITLPDKFVTPSNINRNKLEIMEWLPCKKGDPFEGRNFSPDAQEYRVLSFGISSHLSDKPYIRIVEHGTRNVFWIDLQLVKDLLARADQKE